MDACWTALLESSFGVCGGSPIPRLRACSFCKSGIYHDTAECLGEVRGPEASFTHKAFPWCCPKCFKRGKAALEKQLLAPVHTTGNKRKH